MAQVNIHAAKTQFSKLLVRVAAGEEIVIAKAGKPVAKLVPFSDAVTSVIPASKRRLGALRGKISIGPDFDAPLEEFFPYMYDNPSESPVTAAGDLGETPVLPIDRVAEGEE